MRELFQVQIFFRVFRVFKEDIDRGIRVDPIDCFTKQTCHGDSFK